MRKLKPSKLLKVNKNIAIEPLLKSFFFLDMKPNNQVP